MNCLLPNVAEVIQPMSDLPKKGIGTNYRENHFLEMKLQLTKFSVLTFCDPTKLIIVAADAKRYGLGATVYQEVREERTFIAFTLCTFRTKCSDRKKNSSLQFEPVTNLICE